MNRTIALVIVKAALGGGVALSFAAALHGTAHADTVAGYDAYAAEVGDDNADGRIDEDESGWDCWTMGNRHCGRRNAQGAIPGDYTTVWADGSPAWPTGEYAYDAGAYVGGYN
jgi:hypothetical protein